MNTPSVLLSSPTYRAAVVLKSIVEMAPMKKIVVSFTSYSYVNKDLEIFFWILNERIGLMMTLRLLD